MADTDKSLKLGVDVDEASLKRAKQRLEDIEKAQNELRSEFLRGAKSADAYSKELSALEKEASVLNKTLDKLEEPRDIEVRKAQLDFADQSGDKASIAGLARGGLDALTGGNAGAIGKFFEGAEALFDLGEAAGKAGGPVGDLVKKMGPSGLIGAAAAAGVALVILSKVLEDVQKTTQREVAAVATASNTLLEINTALADGITTDEAKTRLEEINREMGATVQTITDVKTAQQRLVDEVFGGNAVRASQTEAFKEFNNQIGSLEDSLGNLGLEQRKYTEFIEDGTLAANDAAAAEKRLAEERTAGVLEEASQAGELATLKARATELTQEQIDAELQALEVRRAGLEAELAALKASGDTTPEVAAKIEELTEQLGFLGEQAGVLNSAKLTAKSSEAEKAAEEAEQERTKAAEEAARKQEQSAQKAQQAADDARRAQDSYTQAVKDAKQGYRDALADIRTGLGDTLLENNEKLEDSLNEQAIKFNESELAEEAAYQRDLAKIKRDAERAEKDAVRQRDFAALAEARESRDDALDDREDAEAFSNAQQLIAFKQQQDALGRERERADRDALQDAERARRDAATARDRQVRDARNSYDIALRDQQNFGQQFVGNMKSMFDNVLKLQTNTSRSGTSTSTRSTSTGSRTGSRSGTSMDYDDMQYMVGQGGR